MNDNLHLEWFGNWPLGWPSSEFLRLEKYEMADSDDKQSRVLLVDDDYEILEAMRLALDAKGYDVLTARDGNEGLKKAEQERPDLMIIDMMMPKRSGFLVLEKLVKKPSPGSPITEGAEQEIPVIMITANEGKRHKEYAKMLGVRDYIHKPFAMDELLQAVKQVLSKA